VGSILFWVGALVVVSLLSPLLKIVIAALAGKQIGAAALAKQPDTIRLRRGGTWKNAPAPGKIVAALTSRGFEDAGAYTITEMPGMVVQLLADAVNGLYAAIYEHPQAGSWLELFSHFQDGTSVTYSTSRATGLKPRSGHPSINMPGAEPIALLDKALTMRPRRPLEGVSVAKAVEVFERAYAEGIAYRKQVGISTREVVKAAARKAA